MSKLVTGLVVMVVAPIVFGCGAAPQGAGVTPTLGRTVESTPTTGLLEPTPMPTAQAVPSVTEGGTVTAGSYPRFGHAPDYTWIAGKVTVTGIQGGCVYIVTDAADPMASTSPTATGGSGGVSTVMVSTAVRGDTSPPLRDITPQVPGSATQQPPGTKFIPGGPGWDGSNVNDGEFIVAFGRLAGPDDAREMCPGGTQYVIERYQPNP